MVSWVAASWVCQLATAILKAGTVPLYALLAYIAHMAALAAVIGVILRVAFAAVKGIVVAVVEPPLAHY